MKFLTRLLASTLSVFATAYVVPGVDVSDIQTAFIVAIVLGALNVFVKPLVLFLTLPINVLTLGLFTFVINVGLIMLAAYLVAGFTVHTLLAALIFGVVMSIISSFLNKLSK